jgi:hypothetical protein
MVVIRKNIVINMGARLEAEGCRLKAGSKRLLLEGVMDSEFKAKEAEHLLRLFW